MIGHRLHNLRRVVAACVPVLVSLPSVASAQYGPYPPYGQPYAQPPPGPYAQPLPYGQPPQAPGYVPLRNNGGDMLTDRAQSWPIFRVSPGAGMLVDDRFGDVLPSFELDVTAGYRLALNGRVFLMAEGGYTLSTEPSVGGHFGSVGVGPGLHLGRFVSVAWVPRFVIGETWLGLGAGVRNTLVVPLVMHVVNVELGHQWLWSERRDIHEVRAQIGLDLAAAVHFLAWERMRPRR